MHHFMLSQVSLINHDNYLSNIATSKINKRMDGIPD